MISDTIRLASALRAQPGRYGAWWERLRLCAGLAATLGASAYVLQDLLHSL